MTRWRWFIIDRPEVHWPLAAIAATLFLCGLCWQHSGLLGGGAAVLCLLLVRVGGDGDVTRSTRVSARPGQVVEQTADVAACAGDDPTPTNSDDTARNPARPGRQTQAALPNTTEALVDELLATGRYALLLRPETKQHLAQSHVVRAVQKLDEAMALVPGGRVLLGQLAEQSSSACGAGNVDPRLTARNLVSVEAIYLDRFCVTNDEYQQFVDAGGYEQPEFWHEEALTALLDFVDQTGVPAPACWTDGRHPSGTGRLPVVGVSWYEAAAYARWVGKRLPTDAEWTKAGAWPVESAPGRIAQRRYPWGESFDTRRAALYGAGHQGPVAVDEYAGGMSVGGIHQLIGNVWEWTASPLAELGDPTLYVSDAVISIRGGAFDTYFENQATCHYQSGEQPLSRRPNIGLRLALPMRDLEAAEEDDVTSGDVEEPVTEVSATEEAAAC